MKKAISIILITAFLLNQCVADSSALRPIAHRSSMEQTADSEDSLTREEKIARARALLESLRPQFHGKKKLTTRAFEEHIRNIAEEQGVAYIRATEGPISFMKTNARLFCELIPGKNLLDLLAIFAGFCLVVGFFAMPICMADDDENRLLKLEIRIPGKTSFIFPLNNALLIRLLFPSPPRHWPVGTLLILYQMAFFTSVIAGNIIPDRTLHHELKHAYVYLLLNKLKQEDLMRGDLGKISSSLPSDSGTKFIFTMLTIKELEEVEDSIIDKFFVKERQIRSKPRHPILRRLLRMPTRPVDLPALPMARSVNASFTRDVFTFAQAA